MWKHLWYGAHRRSSDGFLTPARALISGAVEVFLRVARGLSLQAVSIKHLLTPYFETPFVGAGVGENLQKSMYLLKKKKRRNISEFLSTQLALYGETRSLS